MLMIRAITLGFISLSDKGIMALLLKTVAFTLLAFLIFGVALWYGLDWLFIKFGWQDGGIVSGIASFVLMALSFLLLFRIVGISILWIFSDAIIDAVEAKHYPEASAKGTRPTFATGMNLSMKSLLRVLGYNILALPLYLILLFTGIGTLVLFLILNAFLLSRDFEDMLVTRHGSQNIHWSKGQRWLLGLAGTAGMMVPLLQLIVPVVATAAAVHMAHQSTSR
jgi:CysZ protein